jgi:hypothetical protein
MVLNTCECGPIRPPSEAFSLLLRVVRNCPWNRCRFCFSYRDTEFSLRSVEDIKSEIDTFREVSDSILTLSKTEEFNQNLRKTALSVMRNPPSRTFYNVALWMSHGAKTAFLQDADAILMRTPELVEVLKYLRSELPTIERVTSYGRSLTASHKSIDELKQIHEAGLDRLHIGLESGSDAVLKMMNKGVTAPKHIEGGRNVKASGISLSEYVLLGLGGEALWMEHAVETARVLNAINPDFIRIRSLALYPGIDLCEDVEHGDFIRQTDEAMVEELRVLIENLDCTSNLVSDHIGNLLQDVQGNLPEDKEKMLSFIAQFQSMTLSERLHFRVGRRAGIYTSLFEMQNESKKDMVDDIINRLSHGTGEIDDETVYQMRLRYH